MLDKDAFFRRYGISGKVAEKATANWENLENIYVDFTGIKASLVPYLNLLSEQLRGADKVHSIRARLKDPEHLIEKIIRKHKDEDGFLFTVDNYRQLITDIIGMRAIHLYKEDWFSIHSFITGQWELHEQPTANVREGDNEVLVDEFKKNGCQVRVQQFGYRSVHYVVKIPIHKDKTALVEIQVRTIFEEGWSEIDHDLRYPYGAHPLIAQHLILFNRIAGSSDEMGSYGNYLKMTLNELESEHKKKLENSKREIDILKLQISELEIGSNKKEKLQESIGSISSYIEDEAEKIRRPIPRQPRVRTFIFPRVVVEALDTLLVTAKPAEVVGSHAKHPEATAAEDKPAPTKPAATEKPAPRKG